MPIQNCTGEDGKPGYKWGANGACFVYTPGNNASRLAAKKKAIAQALAINYALKRQGNAQRAPTEAIAMKKRSA